MKTSSVCTNRARDWFSNRVLALETSIQDVSFDEVGYPLACAFNSIHFVVRLPHFYSSLPPISSLWTSSSSSSITSSRYLRQAAQLDADARLTALTTATSSSSTWFATGWIGWTLSVTLVLVSVANTLYLASRTRKYQLMLRKVSDPPKVPRTFSRTLILSRSSHEPGPSIVSECESCHVEVLARGGAPSEATSMVASDATRLVETWTRWNCLVADSARARRRRTSHVPDSRVARLDPGIRLVVPEILHASFFLSLSHSFFALSLLTIFFRTCRLPQWLSSSDRSDVPFPVFVDICPVPLDRTLHRLSREPDSPPPFLSHSFEID